MAKGTSISFLLSQVRNANSALVGGTVTFYVAGTSTLKNVYLDRDMLTLASNPYTLDSNATAQLFGIGLYRVVVKSAVGATIYDWDNIYVGVDPDNVPAPSIPAAPNKNLANNGSFALWSTGTSFTRTTLVDTHTADGWYITSDGATAGSVTVSRTAFTPGDTIDGDCPVNYCNIHRTSALTGATYERFACRIPDVGRLSGKEVTIRCYAEAVTAPVTVNWTIRQDFGSGGTASPAPQTSDPYAIGTSGWDKLPPAPDVVTLTVPSVVGKTIGSDSYTEIGILLPVNTTYELNISQVQFEFGTEETAFEWLREGEDFMRANGFGTGTPVFSSATLTVSTGTPPLTISSTTAVTNLNADLLDGQHGAYYQDAANLNAGEIPLARIPATLTGKDADTLDGQHGAYYLDASNLNAGTVPTARLPQGLSGFVSGSVATTVTVNAVIPVDDTIPQSGEGVEVITLAYTPKSATSVLKIEFNAAGYVSAASTATIVTAMFQDATASAFAANHITSLSTNIYAAPRLVAYVSAGSTSARTYKVRMGTSTGSVILNAGNAGTRVLGGVEAITLSVTEIPA